MKDAYLIILIIIGLLFSVSLQSIAFTSKYIVNDDVRASLFIIPKFNDSDLFKNDILADHALAGIGSTKAVQLLYSTLDKFIEFILITKILPIILFLVSLIFFYLTSKQLFKKETAFISSVLFTLFSWSLQLFSGGLSRAFLLPLLIIFLYFFLKDKDIPTFITILVSSFLYPPSTLIMLLTYSLTFVNKNLIQNIKSKKFIYLLITALICVLIIQNISVPKNKEIGSFYSFKEVIKMEEFQVGGKIPVLNGIFSIIKPYNTGIKTSLTKNPIAILILLSIISIFVRTNNNLNKKLKIFAISGLILYFLSFILLFKIYIPIRYLLPVYLVLIFFISNRINKFNFNLKKLILISLLLFLIFIPHLRRDLTICWDKDIYNFISTLPKDSLIVGYPKDLDCIPLFSKRSVLINDELNIPFAKNYYEKIKLRLIDLFIAYYSDNEQDIINLCKKYNITHILVNKERFSKDSLNKERIYYNPFDKLIKERKNNDFILPKQEDKAIFSSKNQFILSCL